MKINDYFKTLIIAKCYPKYENQSLTYIWDSNRKIYYAIYYCLNEKVAYRHPGLIATSKYSDLYSSIRTKQY